MKKEERIRIQSKIDALQAEIDLGDKENTFGDVEGGEKVYLGKATASVIKANRVTLVGNANSCLRMIKDALEESDCSLAWSTREDFQYVIVVPNSYEVHEF